MSTGSPVPSRDKVYCVGNVKLLFYAIQKDDNTDGKYMIIYQQNIAMATTEATNNGPKEQAFSRKKLLNRS